jgi:hypothetical protein
VGIHAGWKIRLFGNELSTGEGMQPVVMVYQGAEADISDNTLRGGGVAAIRTEGAVRAMRNTFLCTAPRKAGPPSFGVWGLPGSDLVLVGNTFKDWRHALQADRAAVTASDNSVSGHSQAGFRIDRPSSRATIVGNVFADEPGVIVTGGEAILENNRVAKPK